MQFRLLGKMGDGTATRRWHVRPMCARHGQPVLSKDEVCLADERRETCRRGRLIDVRVSLLTPSLSSLRTTVVRSSREYICSCIIAWQREIGMVALDAYREWALDSDESHRR